MTFTCGDQVVITEGEAATMLATFSSYVGGAPLACVGLDLTDAVELHYTAYDDGGGIVVPLTALVAYDEYTGPVYMDRQPRPPKEKPVSIFDNDPVRAETGDRRIHMTWEANPDGRNHYDEPAKVMLRLSCFHHNKRYTATLNTFWVTDDAETCLPFDAINVQVQAAPRYSATNLGIFADQALATLRGSDIEGSKIRAMADKASR